MFLAFPAWFQCLLFYTVKPRRPTNKQHFNSHCLHLKRFFFSLLQPFAILLLTTLFLLRVYISATIEAMLMFSLWRVAHEMLLILRIDMWRNLTYYAFIMTNELNKCSSILYFIFHSSFHTPRQDSLKHNMYLVLNNITGVNNM